MNLTCQDLEALEEAFYATHVTCSSRWYNVLRKYSFATEGVGLFTVAVVGVLANLLSIATLWQRTMKSQITALLITLAIFDILFLLCTFPVFTVQSVNEFVAYLNECHYDNADQSKIFFAIQCMSIVIESQFAVTVFEKDGVFGVFLQHTKGKKRCQ